MFEKNVQKLSLQLNKKNYLKSFNIVLLTIFFSGIFSFLPSLLKKLLDVNFIKNPINNINPNLITLLFFVIFIFFSLSALILYSSFSIGEAAWFSGRMSKKNLCYKRFIFWLKVKFSLKAFGLNLLLFALKSMWLFLFCSPSLFLLFTALVLAFSGGIEAYLFISLLIGTFTLLLISLFFSFIINQRYFLAKYLLVENPKLGVIQVIKQSKNLMDGQILRIVKFKLSFMPVFLLYLLILPIIFIHPHYKQCCCIIAKELRL